MSEIGTRERQVPREKDILRLTRQVNELIPILAHGFNQAIEDRGLRGKVQLYAVASDSWSVGKSRDNKYGIPNVITYPLDYLANGDLRVVNARLRHEIGNLNYPFEKQLTELASWSREQEIPPQAVIALAQAIHGPSVDYFEIRNAHSSSPEENFRVMYETEVNVQKIAQTINERLPYRQALDIIFLEGLAIAGIISREVVDRALQGSDPTVKAILTPELKEHIAEAVKTSNSHRKAAIIRDVIFPQLAALVRLDDQMQDIFSEQEQVDQGRKEPKERSHKRDDSNRTYDKQQISFDPEMEARIRHVREELRKLKEQLRGNLKQQTENTRFHNQRQLETHSNQQKQFQEMTSEEQREREQAKTLLEDSLRERLQDIKDQIQQHNQQPVSEKQEAAPHSMQEIGEQAQQMKEQLKQKFQDLQQASQDQQMADELEKLTEQLQQLEEVAQQLSGQQQAQAQEAEDEEPMTYNIKEYGIDETTLSSEQRELLNKIRAYAQKTSKIYRSAMRILMTDYQQHNPHFTDEIIQKMKDRGYDLPDFSIYSPEAAQQFLSQQPELGIDEIHDKNFLVNFNLPRPISRMWYRGGDGARSVPVEDGAIEWGEFYRRTLPIIWEAVDRAAIVDKISFHRLNQFGQYNPKKYYYLYEASNIPAMDDQTDTDEQADQANQSIDQNTSQQSESQNNQPGEDKQQLQEGQNAQSGDAGDASQQQNKEGQEATQQCKAGSKDGGQEKGQGDQSGHNGQQSSQGGGSQGGGQGSQLGEGQGTGMQRGQPGQGEMGSISPQTIIEDLLQQVQQMLNEAKERGGEQGSRIGQDGMSQTKQELQQLIDEIKQLQKQEEQQNGQSGSESGHESQQGEAGSESGSQGQNAGGGQSGQASEDQNAEQESSEPSGKPSSRFQPQGQGQQGAQAAVEESSKSGQAEQRGEGQNGEGSSGGEGSDIESGGEGQEQDHEQWQRGGSSHKKAIENLFEKRNKRLLEELEELNNQLASKFSEEKDGNFRLKAADTSVEEKIIQQERERLREIEYEQIAELERIKKEQQNELRSYYQEMSGLDGLALDIYIEYMREMEEFIDEVSEYFRNRFHLDQEYQMTRDQFYGSRLQKGWQENIIGSKDGKPLLRPTSFERRLNPKKPTILWTLIIDNSGSCDGEIIEQEKKLAVGLIEVAKRLNIPFEILTFGGPDDFIFLKTHDQEIFGEDLQKIVLLRADEGTPDVKTLEAACSSMRQFSDQFKYPNSFVYFMTDGESGRAGRTISDVINDYRRDMVITGIGLGSAAATIERTWGKNALPVPDVSKLSQQFLDKIEEQIEEIFD